MAEEGTLCINADVAKFAGSNASTTANVEAYTNVYIKQAEAFVCASARYDYVTNYASVSDIGKEALREAVASYAACDVINADMSGFTSRQEAIQMVNLLWAKYIDIVKRIVKDNNYKDFILDGEGDID